jgi:hypothetical protein
MYGQEFVCNPLLSTLHISFSLRATGLVNPQQDQWNRELCHCLQDFSVWLRLNSCPHKFFFPAREFVFKPLNDVDLRTEKACGRKQSSSDLSHPSVISLDEVIVIENCWFPVQYSNQTSPEYNLSHLSRCYAWGDSLRRTDHSVGKAVEVVELGDRPKSRAEKNAKPTWVLRKTQINILLLY